MIVAIEKIFLSFRFSVKGMPGFIDGRSAKSVCRGIGQRLDNIPHADVEFPLS
jgi:hypothetical protein